MMGDFARYKAFAPPCSRGETIRALFLLPVLGSSSWHSQAPGPLALVLLPDLSRSPRRPFRFGTPAPGSQTEAEALLADVPALVNVGIPLCYRVPWKWRDVRWQTVLQKELERLRENHPKIQAVVFASNQAQISNQSPAFNEWIWQLRSCRRSWKGCERTTPRSKLSSLPLTKHKLVIRARLSTNGYGSCEMLLMRQMMCPMSWSI
ncbi:hypothetical protein IEQ34_016263 [Dendrobium chrysotoxum]|uniref:Uncharacterized protein n=1 Tax=Dendrobium chrysotoxum TaxID=161865 RepID=A0AAV7GF87_DENCH|nr:hypothetical protein IEQ34_016263 [Dendrobium chrysotoxum]